MCESDVMKSRSSEGHNELTEEFVKRCFVDARSSTVVMRTCAHIRATAIAIVCNSYNYSKELSLLEDCLNGSGISATVVPGVLELQKWQKDFDGRLQDALVISISIGMEDQSRQERLNKWCREHRLSWLRVSIGVQEDCTDIGPLFEWNTSPCYRCFSQIHLSNLNHCSPDRPSMSSTTVCLWLAIAGSHIILHASGCKAGASGGGLNRFDQTSLNGTHVCTLCIPTCECNEEGHAGGQHTPDGTRNESALAMVIAYEDAVAWNQVNNRISTKRFSSTNMKGKLDDFELRNSMRYDLSSGGRFDDCGLLWALNRQHEFGCTDFTAEHLALLLKMTGGIRSEQSRHEVTSRWSASAGNLGSVQLFVAVRNVGDIPSGFYQYHPNLHALLRMERQGQNDDVSTFLDKSIPRVCTYIPAAVIVLVGSYSRVYRKYGPFAYKLINFDAGVAISQLHLCSRALNIDCTTETDWEYDIIQEQFNLRPPAEQITAILSLSLDQRHVNRSPYCKGLSYGDRLIEADDPRSLKEYGNLSLDAITVSLFREGCRKPQSWGTENSPGFSNVANHNLLSGRGSGVVPPIQRDQKLVWDVLAARTSRRKFSCNAVQMEHVYAMLDVAIETESRDWRGMAYVNDQIEVLVLAMKVDSLQEGVYKFDNLTRSLNLLRAGLCDHERAALFIQEEFTKAPVVLWITGKLVAVCNQAGAYGHRSLFVHAGVVANRMWMAAINAGLVGTIVAGIKREGAQKVLGIDGRARTSILALPIGLPVSG
jgi:SagB-type dehydrogenase family enzyme